MTSDLSTREKFEKQKNNPIMHNHFSIILLSIFSLSCLVLLTPFISGTSHSHVGQEGYSQKQATPSDFPVTRFLMKQMRQELHLKFRPPTTTRHPKSVDLTSSESTSTADEISRQIYLFRVLLPRVTFTGRFISPKFEPTSRDYWESLGVLSLLGAIFTVTAIAFSLLFNPLRQLGLCGGYEPTQGNCCGPTRKKPYPRWQILLLRAASIFLLFVVILVCVAGFLVNQQFTWHLEVARTSARSTILNLTNRTTEMTQVFKELEQQRQEESGGSDGGSTFDGISLEQEEASNQTRILFRELGRANKIRGLYITIIFSFCILVPILNIIAGFGNWKDLSNTSANVGFYVLVAVCIGFAIHFPISFLVGDFCISVDQYVRNFDYANQTSNEPVPGNINEHDHELFLAARQALELIIRCKGNQSLLGEGFKVTEDTIQVVIDDINRALQIVSGANTTFNYTFENVEQALELDFVQSNEAFRNAIEQSILMAKQYGAIIRRLIHLSSCEYVAEGYSEIRNAACVGALRTIDLTWLIFLLLLLVEVPCIIVAVLGYKRFRKKKYVVPKKVGKSVNVEMQEID